MRTKSGAGGVWPGGMDGFWTILDRKRLDSLDLHERSEANVALLIVRDFMLEALDCCLIGRGCLLRGSQE